MVLRAPLLGRNPRKGRGRGGKLGRSWVEEEKREWNLDPKASCQAVDKFNREEGVPSANEEIVAWAERWITQNLAPNG